MSGVPSIPANKPGSTYDDLCLALDLISSSKTPQELFERLTKTLHELADHQPIALYRRLDSEELRLTYCYPAASTMTSHGQLLTFRSQDELRTSHYHHYELKGEHDVWGYIGLPTAPPEDALQWVTVLIDIAAQRLHLLKAKHMAERQLGLKARRRLLSRDIKRLTSLADFLQRHGHGWCDIFQASGIALTHKGELYYFGECPDRQQIFQQLGYLDTTTDQDSTIELDGDCQGGLAAPLNLASNHLGWLLIFRQHAMVTPGDVTSIAQLTFWLPIEASMVLELADDLAVAITALDVVHVNRQLRKTNQRLESLAHTDLLTRCWNRYYTEFVIEELCASNATCAVLMFDIDDFKRINDTYGHPTGDDILREIARLATQTLRSNDHLGRWGGEEFIVIIADVTLNEGICIAKRLRCHIEQHSFAIPDSVTISAGLTTIRTDESPRQLLERVDKGMYLAKTAGKNQVMIC